MSGTSKSGNQTGRVTTEARLKTVENRIPSGVVPLVRAVKDLPKLKYIPEMPASPWKNARANMLWIRLADKLIRHQMISELDLELLELTVHTHWLMEKQAAEGNYSGGLVNKLQNCYKSLGLTPDGRLAQGIGSVQEGATDERVFGHLLD